MSAMGGSDRSEAPESEESRIDVSLERIMERIASGHPEPEDSSSYQALSLRRADLLQSPVVKKIERMSELIRRTTW